MRQILAAAFLALTALPARAGCGSHIAQCVWIDSTDLVRFNGLCAATTCANQSEAFYFMRYSSGREVRIDFVLGTNGLPRPQINGMRGIEILPATEQAPWVFMSFEGDVYLMLDCPGDCEPIDPVGYAKLLEEM